MDDRLSRLWVGACGFGYAALGALFLTAPQRLADFVPLAATGPGGLTEIRALYGGLELAIGGLLITGARGPHVRVALAANTFLAAGLALGRVAGLLLDGGPYTEHMPYLSVELGIVAGSLLVAGRDPR